jgi:hypothetical protein
VFQGPQPLTLNTVYLELDAALTSRDLHRPRQNNNDTAAGLALARNPVYGRSPPTQTPVKIVSSARHPVKPDEPPHTPMAGLAGSRAVSPPEPGDRAPSCAPRDPAVARKPDAGGGPPADARAGQNE